LDGSTPFKRRQKEKLRSIRRPWLIVQRTLGELAALASHSMRCAAVAVHFSKAAESNKAWLPGGYRDAPECETVGRQ
jgi:hypothetical protein